VDFRAFKGSNRVMTSVVSVCLCVCVCGGGGGDMKGKYACNTHPVSVYYGEVNYDAKVMREGGRMDVLVICYKN
jgi:hypothetical protein